MLCALIAASLAQAPTAFRSDGGTLAVDGAGRCRLLAAADGTELHDGAFVPIAEAVVGEARHPATAFRPEGTAYRVEFGSSGVVLHLAVRARPEAVEFRVESLEGTGPTALRFVSLSTRGLPERGRVLNVRSNDRHAVCVLGLSPRVDAAPWGGHGLGATVVPEFGMVGEGAALVIASRDTLLESIRRVEHLFSLPSPTIDGEWAKTSRAAKGSYLFTDLAADNVDATIRFAKMGGFETILIHGGTWASSSGSYPIHTRNFPGGEAALRRVVERCRAAGLRVGLHVLSSMVSKHDPLGRALDPRLLTDAEGTLAQPVSRDDTTLVLSGSVDAFPSEASTYGNVAGGTEVRVGTELIRYTSVDRAGRRLLGCQRGIEGTSAEAHAAGSRVAHLAERYRMYLADLRTDLLPAIADRIAGLVDRCGIDMLYFDGGENASANGPYWYWVGRVQDEVMRRIKRDVVVQGSGITHWTWHWFTRGTCDDYAALAPAAYLDEHKIADSFEDYRRDFLPAELGWWGLLAEDPAWPATTLADVDAYGARMVALDAPVSVQTTYESLAANPQTPALLQRLAAWETLRRGASVGIALRQAMRTGQWTVPGPVRVARSQAVLEGDGATQLVNPFDSQSPWLRLEVLPAFSEGPAPLLAAPVSLPVPPSGAPMPGWSAARVAASADLSSRRALRIVLDAPAEASGAVLNVQLEAEGRLFRDHLIDVVPGRTIATLSEPSAERMLREFRPAHGAYAFKAAVYRFDYSKVRAVNLRWMRAPSVPGVRVLSIAPMREGKATLVRPTLRLGSTDLPIPATLRSGDAVEFAPDGAAVVLGPDGSRRSTFSLALPLLARGESPLRLFGSGPVRVRIWSEFRARPPWE